MCDIESYYSKPKELVRYTYNITQLYRTSNSDQNRLSNALIYHFFQILNKNNVRSCSSSLTGLFLFRKMFLN